MSQYLWVKLVGSQRAHIVLPEQLVQDIDALVGTRGRSAFLVEVAQAEVRRRQLLNFLQSDAPVWHDENHPDLTEGSATWVRKQRQAWRPDPETQQDQ